MKTYLKIKQQTIIPFIKLTLYNDDDVNNSTNIIHNISYYIYKLYELITSSNY